MTMKRFAIWSLAILNVLLVAGLVNQSFFSTPAHAQAGRRPSEYLMVPGDVNGIPNGVVFMLDVNSGQLSMMAFNGKELDAMPPIDLGGILERAGGGRAQDNKKGKNN